MDINLEHYKLFYNVAKCGSFSKAAEQLYISQPAITQSIKKLETSLGGTLFYRTAKGITLTEEGENLFNFIENSIETLNNAHDRFIQYKNLEKGKIVIKGSKTVTKQIIEEPIIKFIKDYPNIQIELINGGHKDSLRDLSEGNIDIAVLNLPVSVDYKNIQIIKIDEKDLVFVMSKKYQKENNVSIKNIKDILKYNLIVPRRGTKYREILDSILTNDNEYKYEIMSEEIQINLTKKDLGIAFVLKDRIKDELERGELIEIDIKEKPKIEVGIGVYGNKLMNFATKEFLKYVK